MYFKFAVLLISSALTVNPVVGPKGELTPLPPEDEVLDGYFRMVLRKVGKESTDTLTKEEFFTFLGYETVNREDVKNFLNNTKLLETSGGCVNLDEFKSLLRGVCQYFFRNIDGSIYLPVTPIAFAHIAMTAWDKRTGTTTPTVITISP